ncbi:MAG: hypothetical protein H5T66_05160 [Chloroflexi bacterium]|nr:hypothetical protein [Chloroflexota bacterium]
MIDRAEDPWRKALAQVTPERVRQAVQALLAELPADQRMGVTIGALVQRLMAELGIEGEIESSRPYFAVKDAVRAAVAQSRDLRYLETPG